MAESFSFSRRDAGALTNSAPAPFASAQISPGSAKVRLLCATRYGALGASSRLRLAQYIPFLQNAGLDVRVRAFLSDGYLEALYSGKSRILASMAAYLRAASSGKVARSSDLLWIEKEYLPWLPYWLERAAIGKTPYILDFDDAWWVRYERSRSRLVRLILGSKFRQLVRGAALTITANETLFNWVTSQGAANVLMLPTVVDLNHYVSRRAPDGVFTIGWIGTPLTAEYLAAIAEPLRVLAAEAPLKLLIIGAPDARISGVECESLPWSAETEAALISRCHAGIMPLPDTDWANGKSGYKLIQYMAMRRPAVASAIGANNKIVADGATGFLVRTHQEWLEALRKLRNDKALCERLGQVARVRVEQHYCLDVTAPILFGRIRAILGNTG